MKVGFKIALHKKKLEAFPPPTGAGRYQALEWGVGLCVGFPVPGVIKWPKIIKPSVVKSWWFFYA